MSISKPTDTGRFEMDTTEKLKEIYNRRMKVGIKIQELNSHGQRDIQEQLRLHLILMCISW
jgi:ACT domain-containing protein